MMKLNNSLDTQNRQREVQNNLEKAYLKAGIKVSRGTTTRDAVVKKRGRKLNQMEQLPPLMCKGSYKVVEVNTDPNGTSIFDQ